jgi:hypothetical protein
MPTIRRDRAPRVGPDPARQLGERTAEPADLVAELACTERAIAATTRHWAILRRHARMLTAEVDASRAAALVPTLQCSLAFLHAHRARLRRELGKGDTGCPTERGEEP